MISGGTLTIGHSEKTVPGRGCIHRGLGVLSNNWIFINTTKLNNRYGEKQVWSSYVLENRTGRIYFQVQSVSGLVNQVELQLGGAERFPRDVSFFLHSKSGSALIDSWSTQGSLEQSLLMSTKRLSDSLIPNARRCTSVEIKIIVVRHKQSNLPCHFINSTWKLTFSSLN